MGYSSGTVYWYGSPRPALARLSDTESAALAVVRSSIRDGTGVVFSGRVGAGKTTLMAEIDFWLAMRVSEPRTVQRFWLGQPMWTDADAYCHDVMRSIDYGRQFPDWSDDYSAEGIASRAPRLFLDDLGVERPTEYNADVLTRLLYARYTRNLPTWITTNLTTAAIAERYGDRILSRLVERSRFIALSGADRRPSLSHQIRGPRRVEELHGLAKG